MVTNLGLLPAKVKDVWRTLRRVLSDIIEIEILLPSAAIQISKYKCID